MRIGTMANSHSEAELTVRRSHISPENAAAFDQGKLVMRMRDNAC